MKIYNFDSIDSTNDFAERIKARGEDAVISAREQTNGHGSKGRTFVSSKGGLYITKLSFYDNFPASRVFEIMVNASVAVCRTLEAFGLHPEIKWPNDIYVNGKKICGMLINNTFSGDKISSSVVGIGVNIENEFPDDLKEIAVNMRQAGAKGYAFEKVRDALIDNLQKNFTLGEYKQYIRFLGRSIFLIEENVKKEAIAYEIDELGRLLVKEGDRIRSVAAAEVSLRFYPKGS